MQRLHFPRRSSSYGGHASRNGAKEEGLKILNHDAPGEVEGLQV